MPLREARASSISRVTRGSARPGLAPETVPSSYQLESSVRVPEELGGMELMRRDPQSSMAGGTGSRCPVLLLLLVSVAGRVASGVVTDGEI